MLIWGCNKKGGTYIVSLPVFEIDVDTYICTVYYKDMKTILEKRREIKDELLVLTTILSLNVSNVTSERIQKIVGGLENRVFTIREVENYENI